VACPPRDILLRIHKETEMTAMQPAARKQLRSNLLLAAMLVFGDVFFFACVAGRGGTTSPADWSRLSSQPGRMGVPTD